MVDRKKEDKLLKPRLLDEDHKDGFEMLKDWFETLFMLSIVAQVIAIPLLLAYGVWVGAFPIWVFIGFCLFVWATWWWLK